MDNLLAETELSGDEKDRLHKLGFSILHQDEIKNNNYKFLPAIKQQNFNSKYELVRLGDVCLYESGSRPKGGITNITEGAINLGGEQIGGDGQLNLSKIPYVPLDFYKQSKKGFVKHNDILICKDGALTGKVGLVDFSVFNQQEVMVNEHVYIVRADETKILQNYLFLYLHSKTAFDFIQKLAQKTAQPGLNQSELGSIQIPLPSLEEQHNIVSEIQSYRSIIKSTNELINHWKPNISVKKEWEIIKLNDICKNIVAGGDCPDNYSNIPTKEYNIPIYSNGTDENALYGYGDKARITEDSLTISARGTIGHISIRKAPFFPIVRLIAVTPNLEKVSLKFLKLALNKSLIISTGSATQQLTVPMAKDIIVALPPLEEQQIIVEQIEKEEAIIEQNKELIKIMETRIEARLQSLYEK